MVDLTKSGEYPQIIVSGSIAIDRIMNFSGRYQDIIKPNKLHVLSVSVLLDKLEDSRGGVGANIACGLAILGEQPILIGSVGHDGESYMQDLNTSGVNTDHIHISELPTASFNVVTDSDHNQVGGFFQGAMGDSKPISFLPFRNKNILAVVSANNPEAMNRYVTECHENSIRLVYDPGQQVSNDSVDLSSGLSSAELVFVNDYELAVIAEKTHKTVEQTRNAAPIVVTTLGKNGSRIEGGSIDEPIHVGIAKATVLDPTGAGDAFRAGFLYGYLRQWELESCGKLGATLASFIVEKHGTQSAVSLDDIRERFMDNFNQEIKI